jgi:hypothetical protein
MKMLTWANLLLCVFLVERLGWVLLGRSARSSPILTINASLDQNLLVILKSELIKLI